MSARAAALCIALLAAGPALAEDVASQTARTPPAWARDGVLYEIYPRQFSAAGNLAGVTARLDQLKELGVTILWIMPVNVIGQEKKKGGIGSPYAVRDYEAIDPAYGTPADLKALVAGAHARGQKVILDVVLNHSSWDNKLLKEHPDWYKHDKAGNITYPETWTDVAGLNYDAAGLRTYVATMLKRWLTTYDLDGFRADVAGNVPTDFWEQARRELEGAKPDILMLAESEKPELLLHAFDLDYAWALHATLTQVLQGDKPATAIKQTLDEQQKRYPRGAQHMLVSDDHDERRAIARFGEKGALAASALVFTLDGVPLLYNGMEVGDTAESRDPALFEKVPIFWDTAKIRPQFPRFYRQIIALRKAHPGLRGPETTWVHNSDEDRVVTYVRRGPVPGGDGAQEEVLVAINLSSRPFNGIVDTNPDMLEATLDGGGGNARRAGLPALHLEPWEGRFFTARVEPRQAAH